MIKKAILSDCRLYRYALFREWDNQLPKAMFVGLNPSTADETTDDPTLRRCIQYAQSWGYGGLCITNLYAFRHFSPKALFASPAPIGPKNDDYLRQLLPQYPQCVLIWGNGGSINNRYLEVLKLIKNPFCLKINKSGQPAHPLYLPKHLTPKAFIYGNPDQ